MQVHIPLQVQVPGQWSKFESRSRSRSRSKLGPGIQPSSPYNRQPLHRVTASWQAQTRPGYGPDPEANLGHQASVVTTIHRVDRFIGGFPRGCVSLLESQNDFLFNLLARTIVNTVNISQHDVIFIDGGNSIDPYLLTAACRLFKVDADQLLGKVQVARAFTVFQLDTLITQTLERILKRHKPVLVVVGCLAELFLDRDVDWHEAETLFETDFQKLRKLAERYEMAALITNFGREKSIHRFELDRKLRKWLDPEHRISIRTPSRRKLRFIKGTGEFMDYLPLPPYQWTLDDFYPGGDVCG